MNITRPLILKLLLFVFLSLPLFAETASNSLLPAGVPDVSQTAAPWPPPHDAKDSPFAKMPCTSYGSYKVGTNQFNPIWGEENPWDFGPRQVVFDMTGVKTPNQIPAPGVHPRIYCTPSDHDDIARRLKETECGREMWKNLLCYVNYMKGTYDPKADYAQPNPTTGRKERVEFGRVQSPKTEMAGKRYHALIEGDLTQKTEGFWHVFSLEAFRCWIENDQAAAKDLAAAVMTALKIEQAKRSADPKFMSGPLAQPIAGIHLGYTYDFLYNFLTPEQRKHLHDEIANGTWNHDNYGTFNEAVISRSNWATFSYWLIPILAIEGEPGFNDLKIRGMYRGWRNLMTYGWFPSGANFEGEAKNQLGGDGILSFALRCKDYGFENLAAHPNARANVNRFTPHSVIPTRDGFVKYDLLGGCHFRPFPEDLLAFKYLIPDDKAIDFAYRSAVGDHYENLPNRCESGGYEPTVGGGYHDPMIPFLVFASDFDPANTDPGKLGLGNSFFCGDRALLMTRSGWGTNDLMINLHVRQANGGHPFADRNSIMVAGAGRVWAPIYGWGYEGWRNVNNGEVVIDDHSQAEYTPGRMVDFVDATNATFAVGDAKYPWDWQWNRLDNWGAKGRYTEQDLATNGVKIPPGYELEKHTINDFSYAKHDDDYLKAPLGHQPDWLKIKGSLCPVSRATNYPVQYAWRTAGVIRGTHPYALVLDDIRKDDTPHDYTWYLPTEYDVQIVKRETNANGGLDLLLTGDDPAQANNPGVAKNSKPALPAMRDTKSPVPAGQPMLLVRFLQLENDPKVVPATEAKEPTILEDEPPAKPKGHYLQRVRRLAVPAHSVEPGFKVLLYPYRQGDPLPTTTWNGTNTVSVSWPDQKDIVAFAKQSSGKTDLKVSRDNQTLVTVEKPVAPIEEKQ
jgi:hypothetical protein